MFGQEELPTAHFTLGVLQPPLRTKLTCRKVTTPEGTVNTPPHTEHCYTPSHFLQGATWSMEALV